MKLEQAKESIRALLQNNPKPMLRCFLASDFFLAPITHGGHDVHISEDAFKTELFLAFDAGCFLTEADTRLEMRLQSMVFLPMPPLLFPPPLLNHKFSAHLRHICLSVFVLQAKLQFNDITIKPKNPNIGGIFFELKSVNPWNIVMPTPGTF